MLTRIVRHCEEVRQSNLIIILLFPIYLFAQNQTAIRYSQFITASDIKQNITVLASDSLEGRETGKPGQKKAADYIAKQFESFGIESRNTPNYFQEYYLKRINPINVVLKVNNHELKPNTDFTYNDEFENVDFTVDSLIFPGAENIDTKGKVVVYDHEVTDRFLIIMSMNHQFKLAIVVTDDSLKTNKAKSHSFRDRLITFNGKEELCAPVIFITKSFAKKLWKKNKIRRKKKDRFSSACYKVNFSFNSKIHGQTIRSENVYGFVEGSDLRREIVVVSAHYDHLGFHDGKTYYGADDNASGTSAIIALAKAFAQAKREGRGPRRSILFLAFSGEEKGLLGSSYYSDHPVFPLENTVADLNIDMIGRLDAKHDTNANYVYVIGSDKLSSELDSINKSVNKTYTKLDLDYTFNDPADPNRFYYRSDHYNFAKHNIPVIFYFNGVHEDYHKPTDTVDKINFDKVEKISKLVFFTAWELANRDKRIVVDKENDFKGTR